MATTRRALFGAALGGGLAVLGGPVSAKNPAKPAFRLVMLGDSLTAGLGLPRQQTIPSRMQALLTAQGLSVRVVNAGVSGETSKDILARLKFSTPSDTNGVLIAAGANDMLQGLPPKDLSANLQAMVKSLQARGIRVALAGMRAQLSLGAKYRKEFDAVYPAVARAYGIPLYPFLLEGVALNASYNQEDAIHPNAKGAEIIAQRLAPFAASAFDLKRVAK